MLVGLIRSTSPVRLHEESTEYRVDDNELTRFPADQADAILDLQNPFFDHEKLRVYQGSLEFIRWGTTMSDRMAANGFFWDRLDRASTSIPLNIAEGNGKFTVADRCRFFDTGRGCALR